MKKKLIFTLILSSCFFIFPENLETESPKVVTENPVENMEVTAEIKNKKDVKTEKNKEINQENKTEKEHADKKVKTEEIKTEIPEKKQNNLATDKITAEEKTETSESEKTDNHDAKTDNKKSDDGNPKSEKWAEIIQNELQQDVIVETNSENIENNETPDEKQEDVIKKIPLSIASEEVLARPDVEKFRKQYMSPKWSALLYSYLESAMEYRLYVRQQIQERNLPEVLEYLPVVESNYKTSAKSYSGAVGMWQFMANSVYPFLTLNDFVDQRLDPWYSTDAGLSKLEDNFNYFGDWLIAIAAYNCGGGAMTKALKNAGVKDFWYLADNGYLPKQTADYIPKLLAIADLAINSEYYGIDLPNHNKEFELLENEKNGVFDYVTVNKAYSINELAKELRIEQSTLTRLNASYILGITHPTKESKIRLPTGLGASAESALEKMTPIDYPFKYKVVAGDSLWSISRKYNVTVGEICELNNIKENDILSIGKVLYIPSK